MFSVTTPERELECHVGRDGMSKLQPNAESRTRGGESMERGNDSSAAPRQVLELAIGCLAATQADKGRRRYDRALRNTAELEGRFQFQVSPVQAL